MKKLKKLIRYFSKLEILLWCFSVALIVTSFCAFDSSNPITLIASLLGVTSILLSAKGNPIGQLLMIAFSLLYGILSYAVAYYGEMATYLGMTMPMAIFALLSWLKHPYQGKKNTVKVNKLKKREILLMFLLSGIVTVLFYFILRAFQTANILFSTLSVTTSFLAVYLTYRRSPYFSLAYAFNDGVLLVLWTLQSVENLKYLSLVACFLAFFVNDIYAFISWKKMEILQNADEGFDD